MDTAERLLRIVEAQANDPGLWFVAQTAPEGYLQSELRRLHAAIESLSQPEPQAMPLPRPEQEGEGMNTGPPASETPETDELAHKQWGTWPKPGEIEAFDLARSLERRLREAEATIKAVNADLLDATRELRRRDIAAERRNEGEKGKVKG